VSDLNLVRVALDHPDAARLVGEVQQVYVERYGGTDDSPFDVSEFAGAQGSFFVAYRNGEAVASGAWRRQVRPEGVDVEPCAEIKRMYVNPGHQRRGYARVVLAHLEETARDAGFAALVLETGLKQPEAIALYISCGYREIPNFGFHRDEPLSRCFAKDL
jgi:GNAT superfamily N-acetyltransferase